MASPKATLSPTASTSSGIGGGTSPLSGGNQQQQKQQAISASSAVQSTRMAAMNTNAMVSTSSFIQLGALEVSKSLQDGDKFVKWDEDSGSGTPVTMRVDPKGFYLTWVDQNNEMDLLDISTIRDVRTGPYAKKPRDSKLRQIVTLGSQDTLEEKTITVCYGTDFVNVSFINFCSTRKEIAQHWSEELLRLAYNLSQVNGSTISYLQKAHTKLILQVDKTGKLPVKNILKMFASNKDDRKRVERALDASGLPSGKGDTLPLTKFQFEDFFELYKNLTHRAEVEKIFNEIVGTAKRRLMSTTQLVDFLNRTQRDPRLNEILYPYANPARAKEIIQEYETNKFNAQKGQLGLDGFLRYLMSENNPIMSPNKLELCDDMDQPMSHYFINSSHNTYLTGHQLTGKSSVEIYRQSLLAGCRCVELDFWNGRTEEPVIVHGYTFVPDLFAKDVLEAIAESAFKTSEFPVILSFENHCNPRQQAKIANYCREIFGDMLLDKPLESYPLEPNVELPPPAMLKRKIIIKNKKKHHHHHHHHKKGINNIAAASAALTPQAIYSNNNSITNNLNASSAVTANTATTAASTESGNMSPNNSEPNSHAPPLQQIRQSSKDSTGSSDTDSSSDDESIQTTSNQPTEPSADKVQQTKETEAGAEISALVNYVQPVHFSSFENSEKKNRYYEMSSFDEKQATTLLKERPIEFVNYNKHQLSRVYPAGTRFDSSNFMPQLFWNAGCQLVALNFQTLDLAMQLNLGIFEYNQRCGYLLKPEFMRRTDRRLDPFAESTVDGIIAGTVSITVLSGQFLSDKKIGTYVEVDMYGLPADTVRKKFRTRVVRENGINPVYDEEPFVFKKVVLPELASIRIAVYEENGKFIGHRVLPVIGLCPGYRHVTLRTELGQPITLATLFLCVVVKDYVPDGLSDFAEALANPIKYQSELEKRSQQLAVLTEDTEPTPEDNCPKKEIRTNDAISNYSPKHRGSIAVMSTHSIDIGAGNDTDIESLSSTPVVGSAFGAGSISSQITVQHQQSFEMAATSIIGSSINQQRSPTVPDIAETEEIIADTLEVILDNKLVREKRLELEKKVDNLRKKHDKDKIRVMAQRASDSFDGTKKPKFYMNNRLVKRLSSKSIDVTTQIVPPCPSTLTQTDSETGGYNSPALSAAQSERLFNNCKDFLNQYSEVQQKYYDVIYSTAEKVLRNAQANQMKRLRLQLEKETSDVMRQLQLARRNEVKALAQVHKDRDELVRYKREVASSLVERGVAERVRLTNNYEKKREELQKQHESVKTALSEHKITARNLIEKESQARSCATTDGLLSLFIPIKSDKRCGNNLFGSSGTDYNSDA